MKQLLDGTLSELVHTIMLYISNVQMLRRRVAPLPGYRQERGRCRGVDQPQLQQHRNPARHDWRGRPLLSKHGLLHCCRTGMDSATGAGTGAGSGAHCSRPGWQPLLLETGRAGGVPKVHMLPLTRTQGASGTPWRRHCLQPSLAIFWMSRRSWHA